MQLGGGMYGDKGAGTHTAKKHGDVHGIGYAQMTRGYVQMTRGYVQETRGYAWMEHSRVQSWSGLDS